MSQEEPVMPPPLYSREASCYSSILQSIRPTPSKNSLSAEKKPFILALIQLDRDLLYVIQLRLNLITEQCNTDCI